MIGRSSITEEQIAEFQEFGFAKLPQVLAPTDVQALRAAMAEALRTFSQSPNSYDVTAAADSLWMDEASNDNSASTQHDLDALANAVRRSHLPRLVDPPAQGPRGRFLLDTGVWRRVPALAEFALDGPLAEISAAMLGLPRVRYYDDHLFV